MVLRCVVRREFITDADWKRARPRPESHALTGFDLGAIVRCRNWRDQMWQDKIEGNIGYLEVLKGKEDAFSQGIRIEGHLF